MKNNKYNKFFEEDCRVNGYARDTIINKLRYLLFPPKIYKYLKLLRKIESISTSCNLSNPITKTRLYLLNKQYYRLGLYLSFEIPPFTCGGGLRLLHPGGIIINSQASIGNYFTVRSFTVIGNKKSGENGTAPIIGDNVDVGCNCSIIGDIIIGNNVYIGAGSVVVNDIPDNSVCVGNPARIIKNHKVGL